MSSSLSRWTRWLSPAIGLALFVVAIVVLHRELREVSWQDVRRTLAALPPSAFLLSLALCAVNYGILTGFDLLAFRYIGRKVTDWKVAVVSFTGYAVSNSVGFALISGTSVRYRFYSRWGLTAGEISRIVVFYLGTYFVGLLVLGGWTLAFDPPPGVETLPGGRFVRVLGWILLLSAAAYVLASFRRGAPWRVRGVEVSLPRPRVVFAQVVLSTMDWAFGAAIFYVLLPPSELTFGVFLSAFMASQVVALISHVPGGVGVFEGTMTIFLRGVLSPEQILSALVLYRMVYYVIPLGCALVILLVDEIRQRRRVLGRFGAGFGAVGDQLAPRVLGAFVFLAGATLLIAGAIPTEQETLDWLERVPLLVLEVAYVVDSVIGVGLLVLAHGVGRRLRRAWTPTVIGLGAGAVALVLTGAMLWVPAVVLATAVATVAARPLLDRRARFWDARFSLIYLAGVALVVGASFWVGNYAFRRALYSDDLWLRFALEQDFPRFLRASAAAAAALAVFAVARLLRPPRPAERPPTEAELADAARVIATQPDTLPNLAFLRDKAILFSADRRAFLLYALQRKTWVAMGDVVGDPASAPGLLREFFDRCNDFGGMPVFYQVAAERLPRYADYGLTFVKLGDEAEVPLAGFTPDGPDREDFRGVMERFAALGATFRVVPPEGVSTLLPQLRDVAAAWRQGHAEPVRGFSQGFFEEDYVRRFPLAMLEQDGRAVAFATVWPGAGRQELGVDLMRHRPDAPADAVEALLLHLMVWGRDQGYARFALGMAPRSDLEISAVAPAWSRVGYYLTHRGGAEGEECRYARLREYKERFGPTWVERFLAYPGGASLPQVTEDVTALIEGGYRRIFREEERRRGR